MIRRLVTLLFVAGLLGWATAALAAPAGINTSWKAQVSRAILEGRCDDAKTIALKANDIDTAAKAVMLCKPKAKPAAPTVKEDTRDVAVLQSRTEPVWVTFWDKTGINYQYDKNSIFIENERSIVSLRYNSNGADYTYYEGFDCQSNQNLAINFGQQPHSPSLASSFMFSNYDGTYTLKNLVCSYSPTNTQQVETQPQPTSKAQPRPTRAATAAKQKTIRPKPQPVAVVQGDGTPDDATCQRYGYKPNQSDYAGCRLQLDQMKQQAEYQQRQYELQLQQYQQQQVAYEAQVQAQEKERQRRKWEMIGRLGAGMANSTSPSFLGALNEGFAAASGMPISRPVPPSSP